MEPIYCGRSLGKGNSFLCSCIVGLLILLTNVAVTSSQRQSRCPRSCICRDVDPPPPPAMTSGNVTGSTTVFVGMLIVDCRSRAIDKMVDIKAELPIDVGELDLGENEAVITGSVVRSWFPSLARLRRLRLDHCSLRRLEPQAFRNIRFAIELIDLSHNAIEYVDRNVFREMPMLRTLRLDSNRLGVGSNGLPDLAFRGIEFDSLDLASNGLSTIPDALFDGVKRVTSLRLDDNALETLNRSCLAPIQESLRSLSIRGNRRPMVVADNAVDGIALSVLDVRQSGVRSIAFLENVGSVELLDIGGNPLGAINLKWWSALALSCRQVRLDGIGLEKVDGALLSIFRSAIELDLSDNPIVKVDPDEFRGRVQELRRLHLSNCSLTEVPIIRLVERLPKLETLNLSDNALTDVDSPLEAARADNSALRVLDVANNRIQIFPGSLEPLFNRLDVIRLAGNPVHCNCESARLRRWIFDWRRQREQRQAAKVDSNIADDFDLLRCASPPQAAESTAPLTDRDVTSFVCRSPSIVAQTPNIAVPEDSNVVLSCTADGDPAPEVHWSSPAGGGISVTPPTDRRQNRSTALWSTRRIRRKDAGWYICNASWALSASMVAAGAVVNDGAGPRIGYTYVHVIVPGEPVVELTDLAYPALPSPAISSAPSAVASAALPSSPTTLTVNGGSVSSEPTPINDEIPDSLPTSRSVDVEQPVEVTTAAVVASSVDSTAKAGDVAKSTIFHVVINTTLLDLSSFITQPSTDAEAGKSTSARDDEDGRPSYFFIAIAVGVGLAVLVLALIVVLLIVCLRYRENRRRRRCYARPPPLLTSTTICNKYSSDDALADPPSRSRFTPGPSARNAGGGGGAGFKPGISLASESSSSSRPLRGSNEDVFFAASTFGRRPQRSTDDQSTTNGSLTEQDVLLDNNNRVGSSARAPIV